MLSPKYQFFSRDFDSVVSYADPDPPNLVNADPDPGQKITKIFKKSKNIFNFQV